MIMNLNTSLVKNKSFEGPIRSSIQKHSQEYKVLATLRYLFPRKYEAMTIGEIPDLQDVTNDVGIEVTVAVKENDMRASHAFSELCQGEAKSVKKYRNIIESSGYSISQILGGKVTISATGTSDGEKLVFQESIRKKVKKLQQYRMNFKKIGLAILLPEIPTCYAEDHFQAWLFEAQKENEIFFDFIYVISNRFCICYDIQGKVFEKLLLMAEESKSLSTIARMTAEGELSLDDSEWASG